MRIQVRNLGAIAEADIDLKPLTVLIGPNNVGKTWLAYTLSAILGPYGFRMYTRAYMLEEIQDAYPPLDSAIQQIVNAGNANIDLVRFAEEYGETYINNVARSARQWMRQFMSTARNSFENLEVHVSLAAIKENFLRHVLDFAQDKKISISQRQLSILKETGKRELYIYTSTEGDISEKIPQRVVKELLVDSVFKTLHQAIYPNWQVFPIERTAHITSAFNQLNRAVSAVPEKDMLDLFESLSLSPEQLLRSMSAPIGTFFGMMSSMFNIGTLLHRENAAKKVPEIEKYIHLATLLEETILGGSVDFSTPKPDPKREILFQPGEGIVLEMPVVSSMVKELAPLVLYLRYLAEPGELLVIDEPEMNLHPEAQIKIMEFLAILVNAGLRVLITTHSPNMVDHLENLIRAAEYEGKDQISLANEFFLHHPDAFISQEDLSIYLVDHGAVENILKDGKINWETFGDVSDRVARIHYQL